jgi:hypothetical protein
MIDEEKAKRIFILMDEVKNKIYEAETALFCIETVLIHDFVKANEIRLLDEMQEKLKELKELLDDFSDSIPCQCLSCKYRKSNDFKVTNNFCQWYPSYQERKILLGDKCLYYERI